MLNSRPTTSSSRNSADIAAMTQTRQEFGDRAQGPRLFSTLDRHSASSVFVNDFKGTGHNQGTIDSVQAWSAATNDANQWYQIDCVVSVCIGGVVMQGRPERRGTSTYRCAPTSSGSRAPKKKNKRKSRRIGASSQRKRSSHFSTCST